MTGKVRAIFISLPSFYLGMASRKDKADTISCVMSWFLQFPKLIDSTYQFLQLVHVVNSTLNSCLYELHLRLEYCHFTF